MSKFQIKGLGPGVLKAFGHSTRYKGFSLKWLEGKLFNQLISNEAFRSLYLFFIDKYYMKRQN
jgi:hypothetical protein